MRRPVPLLAALGTAILLHTAAMAPAVAAEEGYGAHLASYFNRADAERGWRILEKRIPAQLKGHQPLYREARVKGRTYIRLLTGPFDTVAAARSYCAEVKRGWSYCDVLTLHDLKPVDTPAPKVMTKPKPKPEPQMPAPAKETPPEPEMKPEMPAEKPAQDSAAPDAMEKPAMADAGRDGSDMGVADFRIEGRDLPPLPQSKARLSPQQRAVFRAIEGNWIQYDGNCSTDLTQVGDGAVRRIVGGTAQPEDDCEVRREGPTVALFCTGGKELWLEVINEDEMVLRRSKAHGGAPYESVDQLLSRCLKG